MGTRAKAVNAEAGRMVWYGLVRISTDGYGGVGGKTDGPGRNTLAHTRATGRNLRGKRRKRRKRRKRSWRYWSPRANAGVEMPQTPVCGNAQKVSIGFCTHTLIARWSPPSADTNDSGTLTHKRATRRRADGAMAWQADRRLGAPSDKSDLSDKPHLRLLPPQSNTAGLSHTQPTQTASDRVAANVRGNGLQTKIYG